MFKEILYAVTIMERYLRKNITVFLTKDQAYKELYFYNKSFSTLLRFKLTLVESINVLLMKI